MIQQNYFSDLYSVQQNFRSLRKIVFSMYVMVYGNNNFAERSKILLDTDLKIILLDHQNNFGTSKIMSCKKFDILAQLVRAFYIIILIQ